MREQERKDRVQYSRWAPERFLELTPENVIDHRFIIQKIKDLGEHYDIREIAFDRWGSVTVSTALMDEGFQMVQFGQGYASMSPPTKELLNLVLSRRIAHGSRPVLRWNIDNLVVKTDETGNMKPAKDKSREKIDGAVALIMALDSAVAVDTRPKPWNLDAWYEQLDQIQQEEQQGAGRVTNAWKALRGDLAPTRLTGLAASGSATAESVQWIGEQALKVIFRDRDGQLSDRLVYGDDEPSLERVEMGRPWSFDGDGDLLRWCPRRTGTGYRTEDSEQWRSRLTTTRRGR